MSQVETQEKNMTIQIVLNKNLYITIRALVAEWSVYPTKADALHEGPEFKSEM